MNEFELADFTLKIIDSLVSRMYKMRFSIDKSVSYTIIYKEECDISDENIIEMKEELNKYFGNYDYSVDIQNSSISLSDSSCPSNKLYYNIRLVITLDITKNITKIPELVAIIEKMKKDLDDTKCYILELIKGEKNINSIKLEEKSKNKYDHIIMTAEEARTIAYKKYKEDRKILYDYILRIGEAIGKAAREGKYSTTFNIEGNVENNIVDEIIDTLKPLGFDVAWDTTDGYYKKLTIKFYSK